jgi:3-carboxy-cis,cis-muconate cycloisomerase
MSDLFWPGDERAGEFMSEPALLQAMVRVEAAWLAALTGSGIAPVGAADSLADLVRDEDAPAVAAAAEAGANPVIALLPLLRDRLRERNVTAATWLHRGLTSQDVLDTALIVCARDAVDQLRAELHGQIVTLAGLADKHRASVMAGRTLTQHAVPITFGLKAATWLQGVLDSADGLDSVAVELPSQFGGAAGTLAGPVQLATLAGLDDPARQAAELVRHAAATLGLPARAPWHTSRSPITDLGDALVRCTDAWGRLAGDVLTLSRPEIGELAEPAADGRGSSSAMPHKVNPVLAVLIRRAALAAPAAGAQLHLAAACAHDERPDGAWHLEWPTLRELIRHALVAASQAGELLAGLRVNTGRMRATAESAAQDLLAESRALAGLFAAAGPGSGASATGTAGYLGANELIIDAILERAASHLKEDR